MEPVVLWCHEMPILASLGQTLVVTSVGVVGQPM